MGEVQPGTENPKLLNEKETAEYLALSRPTLARWRMLGKGPRYCVLGSRTIRYRVSDLGARTDEHMASTV